MTAQTQPRATHTIPPGTPAHYLDGKDVKPLKIGQRVPVIWHTEEDEDGSPSPSMYDARLASVVTIGDRRPYVLLVDPKHLEPIEEKLADAEPEAPSCGGTITLTPWQEAAVMDAEKVSGSWANTIRAGFIRDNQVKASEEAAAASTLRIARSEQLESELLAMVDDEVADDEVEAVIEAEMASTDPVAPHLPASLDPDVQLGAPVFARGRDWVALSDTHADVTYLVVVDPDTGLARSCECDGHVRGHHVCKHMRRVGLYQTWWDAADVMCRAYGGRRVMAAWEMRLRDEGFERAVGRMVTVAAALKLEKKPGGSAHAGGRAA